MSKEPTPQILAQTDRWLVLNKPAGWLTIPGRGEAPVLKAWAEKELGAQIWVVHRIDRDTSGVVLFAKTAQAHREANEWFEKHRVKKAYDFLAQGNPSSPIFKVNAPIEGAASLTQIEVRERLGSGFLGRAVPLSGRRHQIRIHLAQKGHPLLGDAEYGGPKSLLTSQGERLDVVRVALHAASLELPGGERFEAPWPLDFSQWVERLRTSGKA